jgi:hypothetical protein
MPHLTPDDPFITSSSEGGDVVDDVVVTATRQRQPSPSLPFSLMGAVGLEVLDQVADLVRQWFAIPPQRP